MERTQECPYPRLTLASPGFYHIRMIENREVAAASSALLRRAELFSGLLDEDFEYFASRSGSLQLDDGETLFRAGSMADRFWVVESGAIVVERERDVIASFGPGDIVGDFDFARRAERDATARSEGRSRLVVFPRENRVLADLVAERPDASARLLLRSVSMISSRLRSVQRLISENDPWVRELRKQSHTDATTGLATRAYFEEELSKRLAAPTLFLLLKPDRFKELVDARGHGAGDQAMSAIAALLEGSLREAGRGKALRVKSNETALVVPACGREEAAALARKLARSLPALELGPDCAGYSLGASMALGFWPEQGEDPLRLFDSVYALMQRAWRDGGGRVYVMRRAGAGKAPPAGERRAAEGGAR